MSFIWTSGAVLFISKYGLSEKMDSKSDKYVFIIDFLNER